MDATPLARLLQHPYGPGLLGFLTAMAIALLLMPFLLRAGRRYRLYDLPDARKEHAEPVPTLGGTASAVGLAGACALWWPEAGLSYGAAFFASLLVLMVVGVLDDLCNLAARYKLVFQLAAAAVVAGSGLRITGFGGLFGIYELPLAVQYGFTILVITGVTNAFNLIDGIDGLAGGLGFMSLAALGFSLVPAGDGGSALIAFSLAGGLLGFLYYNFNPARIFMGDTGSLMLGFTVATLCVRLLALPSPTTPMGHLPVLVLSMVAVPVFDTLRVFSLRVWQGRSPFSPDKTHLHHVLTGNGWNHSLAARLICSVHALILLIAYLVRPLPAEAGLGVLLALLLGVALIFRRLRAPEDKRPTP